MNYVITEKGDPMTPSLASGKIYFAQGDVVSEEDLVHIGVERALRKGWIEPEPEPEAPKGRKAQKELISE